MLRYTSEDPTGDALVQAMAEPNLVTLSFGAASMSLLGSLKEYAGDAWLAETPTGSSSGCYRIFRENAEGKILAEYMIDGAAGFLVTNSVHYHEDGSLSKKVNVVPGRTEEGRWYPAEVCIETSSTYVEYELSDVRFNHDLPADLDSIESMQVDVSAYPVQDVTLRYNILGRRER